MMAALFGVFSIGLWAVLAGRRLVAIFFWALGVVLSIAMFWHHATDQLKILW
jgi:hypothetical protein